MKKILKELIKYVHMPSFCDEEGYCEALDDCAAIDVGECSCCNINRIVRAFNRGIEYQKQNSKSPWISVEDDLPCNHEEMVQTDFTKLRRKRCEVFSLAYESPRIINISKNHTQIIQKSSFLTQHNR